MRWDEAVERGADQMPGHSMTAAYEDTERVLRAVFACETCKGSGKEDWGTDAVTKVRASSTCPACGGSGLDRDWECLIGDDDMWPMCQPNRDRSHFSGDHSDCGWRTPGIRIGDSDG